MSELAEKIRSLGHLKHKGQKHIKTVLNDDTGKVAGKEIEHWDDRQDAVAMPDPVKLKIRLTEEET